MYLSERDIGVISQKVDEWIQQGIECPIPHEIPVGDKDRGGSAPYVDPWRRVRDARFATLTLTGEVFCSLQASNLQEMKHALDENLRLRSLQRGVPVHPAMKIFADPDPENNFNLIEHERDHLIPLSESGRRDSSVQFMVVTTPFGLAVSGCVECANREPLRNRALALTHPLYLSLDDVEDARYLTLRIRDKDFQEIIEQRIADRPCIFDTDLERIGLFGVGVFFSRPEQT